MSEYKEASGRRRPSIPPIHKSVCAVQLESNLQELKRQQDLESLRPYLIEKKCFSSAANEETAAITLDELKKLCRAWKLNERRNFWKTHTTVDDFVSVLRKHVADTIKPFSNPEAERIERENQLEQQRRQLLTQPQRFNPTFRAKSGLVLFYCGHKMKQEVRHPQDILTRSRYFQFPGIENSLGTVIGKMRVEDFERGKDSFDESSLDDSSTPQPMDTQDPDQVYRQKIATQRSLSVHLLAFSSSNTLPDDDRVAAIKAVQTFLEVGMSSDPDTVINTAMSISNLCANQFMRGVLVEQNCIHRYSAYLPFLMTSDALMACSLFFYYLSIEPEIEDRVCSAGFKMLQKASNADNLTHRFITLQCLSNLLPCAERTRCVDLIINSMHSMYRDFGEKIWTEDFFIILANVSRIPANHYAMIEADFMDLMSVAVAEMPRSDSKSSRLAAEVLGSFLYSPDLAEDLISSDYNRVFIDLLGFDDDLITSMCLHAFAVMSTSEAFINGVCESDVVQIVCSLVSSPLEKRAVENIAYFLCNVCSATLKNSKQRVEDGAAHSMLELMSLYPTNDIIMHYCISGIRDLLVDSETCSLLYDYVVPEILKLIKGSIGSINIHLLECLVNISVSPDCDEHVLNHKLDVEVMAFLVEGMKMESTSNQVTIIKILIALTRQETIVKRLLKNDVFAALKDIVELTSKQQKVDIWNDVARLMLAIINCQPDMTPKQQSEAVDILHHLGSKGSSEQMIADCAIVLAFLSYSIPDFSTVDPIIRSILKISESDTVMAAASTVLYNVSCNENDAHMLLKDNLHINIMIRMMRNGSATVQRNVAEAMRLLCIKPKCNELLLQRELLSDFIVIALLRTNNAEVKNICSEAFYNMLCHENTRNKLLQGDLWWAMMRLSKTGMGNVRMVCARTVFNLATDPENIEALRKNYVINFIKELCSEDGNKYLPILLDVLNNIIEHSAVSVPLDSQEILAIIQVLIGSLLKVTSVECCRWIGYLSSKVASIAVEGSEVNEFVNMDIVDILNKSMSAWTGDVECRQHFSAVLCTVTTHNAFTLATPFHEIQFIMDFLVMHVVYDTDGNATHCPLDSVICENVCQIVMNYVSRDQADVKAVMQLSFFESLMMFALTGECLSKQQDSLEETQPNEFAAMKSPPDSDSDDSKGLSSLKVVFLQILGFVLPELMKYKKISRIRGERANTPSATKHKKSDKVASIISQIPVKSLLDKHLFSDSRCTMNAMLVLHGLCGDKTIAKELMELGLVPFLQSLLGSPSLASSGAIVNFCSLICRNISTHEKVALMLVTTHGVLDLLNELVSITSERLRSETFRRLSTSSVEKDSQSLQIGALFSDVCALLYNVSSNTLPEDEYLTSDGALSIISEISAVSENKDLSHLAKVTIGRILDHSEGGGGFDPSYIAAILSEINDSNALDKDHIEGLVSMRPLSNCSLQLSPLLAASTRQKTSDYAKSGDELWQPIVQNERKRMEFSKIEIESERSTREETREYPPCQPLALESYSKIITTYPFLTTPSTIAEDKERGEEGSLTLIDDGTVGSASLYSAMEGSSLLSGFTSFGQENANPSKGEVDSPSKKVKSTPNPTPPSSSRKTQIARDARINRQQRKVVSSNGNEKKTFR